MKLFVTFCLADAHSLNGYHWLSINFVHLANLGNHRQHFKNMLRRIDDLERFVVHSLLKGYRNGITLYVLDSVGLNGIEYISGFLCPVIVVWGSHLGSGFSLQAFHLDAPCG